MLKQVVCNYYAPVSKFKNNPGAILSEARGEAVAVSSHNEIQFYAVPANLYEEMVKFVEFMQRGRSDITTFPGKFNLTREIANQCLENAKNATDAEIGEFIEY